MASRSLGSGGYDVRDGRQLRFHQEPGDAVTSTDGVRSRPVSVAMRKSPYMAKSRSSLVAS